MRLSHLHQEIIARLHADSRWSHKQIDGFVRKVGYNARSLRVLTRAGLVEYKVFDGPRGGRIVGLRLTDTGKAVADRITAIVEGYAPTTDQGDFNYLVAAQDTHGFTHYFDLEAR